MIKRLYYTSFWALFLFSLFFEGHAVNRDQNILVTETGSKDKRRMSQEEFAFIDTSMKRYGNINTDSDYSSGLLQMLETYDVSFSYDCENKLWMFDLGLQDINQADSQLSMDAEGKMVQVFKITSVSPAQMAYPDDPLLIPPDWDDEGLVSTPVAAPDLKPLYTTVEQPQLKGDETSFNAQDKAYLNQALQDAFGGDNNGKALEGLEKDFTLNRKPAKNKYHIALRMKKQPFLVGNIYVKEGGFGLSFDSLKPPEVESLTQMELSIVDTALKKQQTLWMSTPSNNECLVYDLSKGHQGLLKQNIRPNEAGKLSDITIQTAKIEGAGVIYYMGDYTVFSLWVDLEKQSLSGANWFSLPFDEGLWISSEDRIFIDKSLSRSNASFLSSKKSLQEILDTYNLDISIVEDSWWFRISPKGNPGAFVGFSLDKRTGELGVPMSGH